jgi:hypothetical protein
VVAGQEGEPGLGLDGGAVDFDLRLAFTAVIPGGWQAETAPSS